jgi:cytochrome c-type biogenesis protein CcmH
MIFWLLLVVFTVLVLVLLLRPWSGTGSVDIAQDEDRLRISLYQQNLRELDREFERGQLTPEQLANVRNELELSLLGEIARDSLLKEGQTAVLNQQGWLSAALPVVLIIGMALPLYLYLGNPQLNELKQFSRLAAANQGDTPPPVDGVVPEMQRHLQKNPRDANGWLLLADMFMSLQQYPEAVDAFEQLYQLTGEDTDVMLRYANALVVANNGRFSGKPASMVQRVLAIEPDNYTALLFAGMAEDEAGNYQQANQHYKNLLPALQGNPQQGR